MPILEFIQTIDSAVIYQIYQYGGNLLLDRIGIWFSFFGSLRAGAILLALLFLIRKETRPLSFVLLGAVLLSICITWVLKDIVARPRPYVELGLTAADMLVPTLPYGSFPSGHTTTAFATATVAAYHFRKWAIPIMTAACIAGLMRIYLLVHYPSDVFAGAAIGILSALFVIYLYGKLKSITREII